MLPVPRGLAEGLFDWLNDSISVSVKLRCAVYGLKAHAVKDEVQAGAPSRRASATLTAYGDHLWLIGGGKAVNVVSIKGRPADVH